MIADINERLDAIITEYLESTERGHSSEPTLWLQKYPEFATELKHFFAAETCFDRIVSPLRAASVGSTPQVNNVTNLASDRPLKTVNDYDILVEIGRGGMGVIYKARQRSLNRLVAIKMIRSAEWATPAERMRFRWEAEAIGALDHPNIVPIYEIGEIFSEDGSRLPFFSMKLIEGDNLAHGRQHFRNDWKAIARLMSVVARAVEHAHQRGILHRDLKPANILLGIPCDSNGNDDRRNASTPTSGPTHITPHITDFGLAARAHQQRGQTVAGTIVGTPAYLAPELASGGSAATIASDVYALGAILYEMLTGQPPFQGNSPLETIRKATSSSVTAPRKENSAIPLDLETICLKCLEADPQQRYGSAGKLADDLDLFLAGRPINARPIGRFATFRRWCWRNPWVSGLSAALLLSAAVGLPVIVWSWQRAIDHEQTALINLQKAQEERDRADNGFEVAHQAFGDMFRMLGDFNAEELSESEALNKELLERGLKYYSEFVDRRRDDPKLCRELAAAMYRIAAISNRIKTNQEALLAYEKTIDFMRSLLDQYPDDITFMELLSRSLSYRGRTLAQLDRVDEAIRSHDEAVEIWSRLPNSGEGIPAAQRGLGNALMDRGIAHQKKGDSRQALESFLRARSILLACSDPAVAQVPLVLCYLNIAWTQSVLNQLDPALESAREGLKIAEKMSKRDANAEETRHLMAQSHHRVAKVEMKAGNWTDARKSLSFAQRFYEGLHHAKPRLSQYKRSLAMVYGDTATIDKQQKKPAEALKGEEQSVFLLRELVQADGDSRWDRVLLGYATFRLGEAYRDAKNYAAAARVLEESRTQRRFLLGRNPADNDSRFELARTCFLLGACLNNVRQHKESLVATEEAIEIYHLLLQQKSTSSMYRKNLSGALGNKAICLRDLGRPAEALAATEERMKLFPNGASELYDTALDFARTYNSLSAAGDANSTQKEFAVKLAVQALKQSLEAGLPNLDKVRTDPTFKKIRETEEFQKLLTVSPSCM